MGIAPPGTEPAWAQGLLPSSQVEGIEDDETTDLKGVMADSLRMLTIQHLTRITFQDKTRSQLGGPFFGDYHRSVRMPRQWSDGDSWLTNYIGHPMQGAASGFVWLGNRPRAHTFAMNRDYFRSRLGAGAFAAAYSLQFEYGLLSEASIGNVGLDSRTVGWVDHVVTPTGGFALMLGEDALDRFVIEKIEARIPGRITRALLRMSLNPSRTFANVAALRHPWHRDGRPLRPEPRPQPGRGTLQDAGGPDTAQ